MGSSQETLLDLPSRRWPSAAPSVARVDGDGLLTLEEVLGLRLNADGVVLSACNTASGNGSGSEALSGWAGRSLCRRPRPIRQQLAGRDDVRTGTDDRPLPPPAE